MLIGGCTVITDYETVCDPSSLLALIRSLRITLIELVPAVMKQLLDHASRLAPEESACRNSPVRWLPARPLRQR
jgi:hypothetical protein